MGSTAAGEVARILDDLLGARSTAAPNDDAGLARAGDGGPGMRFSPDPGGRQVMAFVPADRVADVVRIVAAVDKPQAGATEAPPAAGR